MIETKRKGSRSIAEIPTDILGQLNRGEIESANLVEFLGVDRRKLIEHLMTQYDRKHYLQAILSKLDNLEKPTAGAIYKAIGDELTKQVAEHNDRELLVHFSTHPSDIVRCWATYLIGSNEELNLVQMLNAIRPFAADHHFNVRECAWCDVRKTIAQNLSESLAILTEWAMDEDENIRRFASEATRPRGVWCEHIIPLKQNPALGLPILEPLKSDSSKYVRDSVGNWLNDASKTQPEFVTELCKKWKAESDTPQTDYIIKKALRTLKKQNERSK
ncbi:DNA alkylation repair enzyme [Mucinivorans hirudinis]|uniref:DNA alkylation repair enzyme n=1 Tax=Mucinivorans hirudinis TaxID=1433126 RepID=A0A060RBU2_9BACT|nr:DNA alkylation repair enzyme [Mucinivorans hirudinis]